MFKRLRHIGPGAMVAAAFIGPGTVTTATIAGASYGYTLLWAVLFSLLATMLLQEMSARLGIAGGLGVGEALRQKFTSPVGRILSTLLVVGAIVIGNAAYEAGNISGAALGFESYGLQIPGTSINALVIVIGVLAFVLLFLGKYKTIERTLIWLVASMGVIFVASACFLRPNLTEVLGGLFVPSLPEGGLLLVIGLIGTTVVPYNLFLHASSVKQRWKSPADLQNARWDTVVSVIVGGVITMAILISAAAAFSGESKIVTSGADLAAQLEPMLGTAAPFVLALGFLAAGLTSAVTAPLAAAFATSEVSGWKQGDLKDRRFRSIWCLVLLSGVVFSSLGIRPTTIILFAQVANGLMLPVIAIFLVWVMNDRRIMGDNVNARWVNVASAFVILLTVVIGVKGVMAGLQIG